MYKPERERERSSDFDTPGCLRSIWFLQSQLSSSSAVSTPNHFSKIIVLSASKGDWFGKNSLHRLHAQWVVLALFY